MEILNELQGSPQWHAHRTKYLNASDAPVMMGVSPHKTRQQLLHEKHTGVQPEVSDFVQQKIFDKGHEWEALARPLAEAILGEDLFPVVENSGRLSASFDGLTIDESIAFEHKSLSQELRDLMKPGCQGTDLPMHYQVQMEQQCMVSGCAKVLFMASEWTDDGELIEERHCWYKRNKELAEKIVAGWTMFEADLESYQPAPPPAPAPVVDVIEALPALMIRVEGKVTSSNISVFKDAATAFIANINTKLETDSDFANAEQTVKFCQDGEDRLALVKEQALAQTTTIDELFRTIDHISAQLRSKRLELDKAVTARKASIRSEVIQAHQKELDELMAGLNKRLGAQWIARAVGGFAEAIKGKRTVESVRAAASQELANQKLRLQAVANQLADNRAALKNGEDDWVFLFADFATVGTKPTEDFKAIADARIAAHKAAVEAKRLKDEAEKEAKRLAEIAREEARKAAEVMSQQALVADPVVHSAVVSSTQPMIVTLSDDQIKAVVEANEQALQRHQLVTNQDEKATLRLGDINALLGPGITMSESFVTVTLGVPKATESVGRSVMFKPSQLNEILEALAELALSKRR